MGHTKTVIPWHKCSTIHKLMSWIQKYIPKKCFHPICIDLKKFVAKNLVKCVFLAGKFKISFIPSETCPMMKPMVVKAAVNNVAAIKNLEKIFLGKYTLGVFVVKPSNSPKKQTPLTCWHNYLHFFYTLTFRGVFVNFGA